MLLRALSAALAVLAGAAPASALYDVDPAGLRKAQFMEALMFGRGEVGGPFSLVDQRGVTRTLDEFRGRPVLLYFGYTFCPDVCPGDLATLKQVLGAHGEAVQVLFVTLDPERDTPAQLAAYLPHFDVRIVGLTGSVIDVQRVAGLYKAYYAKVRLKAGGYLVEHTAGIYLLDREGRFRGSFPAGATAELVSDVLRDFL